MKKTTLLHSEISYVIAGLGHQDLIVISDCGLPVSKGVKKIDLALTAGVLGLIETVRVVLSEMCVEQVWIADELKRQSGPMHDELLKQLGGLPIRSLPHEQFKDFIRDKAAAVIRTGECTPYANVILQSGIFF